MSSLPIHLGIEIKKISIHKSLEADLQHTHMEKKILSHINYARKYPFAMQCMVAQQREAEENSFNVCYFFIIGSWTMKSEREEKKSSGIVMQRSFRSR